MMLYKKRNRTDLAVSGNSEKMTASLSEQEKELVLKLGKKELFDPHVLLPHAELNEAVYRSVNQFLERYKGTEMTLTILSDPVSEAVQNTFREVYRAHYRDEYNKVSRFLVRRATRSLVLLAVSLLAFLLVDRLNRGAQDYSVFLNVVVNVGAFCLWEVGYTNFAGKEAAEEKSRILRAINANIEFY